MLKEKLLRLVNPLKNTTPVFFVELPPLNLQTVQAPTFLGNSP